MTGLADEFKDLLAELADDLGEGLTATLVEIGVPGSATLTSKTFDPATRRYVISGGDGDPVRTTVTIAPPWDIVTDENGSRARMVLPVAQRSDGSDLVPYEGLKVEVDGKAWQVTTVKTYRIGNAVYGYEVEVRG